MRKISLLLTFLFLISCNNRESNSNEKKEDLKIQTILYQQLLNSPINCYTNKFSEKGYNNIKLNISESILKKISDSINYENKNDKNIKVLNITHLKITDKYNFFNIKICCKNPQKRFVQELEQDSILGFYSKSKLFIVRNLFEDPCSSIIYFPIIVKGEDIILKAKDSYSCDNLDIENIDYQYIINNENLIIKKE